MTSLDLEPGVAVEVSVPAVDVGSVIITADSPVVAGAIVQRTRPATTGVAGDTAQELRWVPGQLADDDNERSAVTVGYDEQVVVYSAQGGTFTLADAEGRTVASAVLGAGGMATVPIKVAPGTRAHCHRAVRVEHPCRRQRLHRGDGTNPHHDRPGGHHGGAAPLRAQPVVGVDVVRAFAQHESHMLREHVADKPW